MTFTISKEVVLFALAIYGAVLSTWNLIKAIRKDRRAVRVTAGSMIPVSNGQSGDAWAHVEATNIGQRPNLVLGVPIYLHNTGDSLQYLNPAAFSLPEVGRFGSLGRGSIRGPSSKNFDLSVVKNWRIHDRYSLQFRAEMFNAFNRPNFNGIDAGLGLDDVVGDENFGRPLNPNFGRITATRGPREIQFGLKFNF